MVKLYQTPPTVKGWRNICRDDRIKIYINDNSNDIYITVETDEPERRIRLFIGREINFIKKQHKKRLDVVEAITAAGLPAEAIEKQKAEAEKLYNIMLQLFPFADFPNKLNK